MLVTVSNCLRFTAATVSEDSVSGVVCSCRGCCSTSDGAVEIIGAEDNHGNNK